MYQRVSVTYKFTLFSNGDGEENAKMQVSVTYKFTLFSNRLSYYKE